MATAAGPHDPTVSRPPPGGWARRSAAGRAALILAVLAGSVTTMMVLLGIGMWRNDMVIDASPVRATATVLTVSPVSTGIEFVDNTGVSQRPPAGVLYPGGLTVGQQFVVEYAAGDPTLVRVAGRSAVNGLIMPVAVTAATWILAGPVLWILGRADGPAAPRKTGRGRRTRRFRR